MRLFSALSRMLHASANQYQKTFSQNAHLLAILQDLSHENFIAAYKKLHSASYQDHLKNQYGEQVLDVLQGLVDSFKKYPLLPLDLVSNTHSARTEACFAKSISLQNILLHEAAGYAGAYLSTELQLYFFDQSPNPATYAALAAALKNMRARATTPLQRLYYHYFNAKFYFLLALSAPFPERYFAATHEEFLSALKEYARLDSQQDASFVKLGIKLFAFFERFTKENAQKLYEAILRQSNLKHLFLFLYLQRRSYKAPEKFKAPSIFPISAKLIKNLLADALRPLLEINIKSSEPVVHALYFTWHSQLVPGGLHPAQAEIYLEVFTKTLLDRYLEKKEFNNSIKLIQCLTKVYQTQNHANALAMLEQYAEKNFTAIYLEAVKKDDLFFFDSHQESLSTLRAFSRLQKNLTATHQQLQQIHCLVEQYKQAFYEVVPSIEVSSEALKKYFLQTDAFYTKLAIIRYWIYQGLTVEDELAQLDTDTSAKETAVFSLRIEYLFYQKKYTEISHGAEKISHTQNTFSLALTLVSLAKIANARAYANILLLTTEWQRMRHTGLPKKLLQDVLAAQQEAQLFRIANITKAKNPLSIETPHDLDALITLAPKNPILHLIKARELFRQEEYDAAYTELHNIPASTLLTLRKEHSDIDLLDILTTITTSKTLLVQHIQIKFNDQDFNAYTWLGGKKFAAIARLVDRSKALGKNQIAIDLLLNTSFQEEQHENWRLEKLAKLYELENKFLAALQVIRQLLAKPGATQHHRSCFFKLLPRIPKHEVAIAEAFQQAEAFVSDATSDSQRTQAESISEFIFSFINQQVEKYSPLEIINTILSMATLLRKLGNDSGKKFNFQLQNLLHKISPEILSNTPELYEKLETTLLTLPWFSFKTFSYNFALFAWTKNHRQYAQQIFNIRAKTNVLQSLDKILSFLKSREKAIDPSALEQFLLALSSHIQLPLERNILLQAKELFALTKSTQPEIIAIRKLINEALPEKTIPSARHAFWQDTKTLYQRQVLSNLSEVFPDFEHTVSLLKRIAALGFKIFIVGSAARPGIPHDIDIVTDLPLEKWLALLPEIKQELGFDFKQNYVSGLQNLFTIHFPHKIDFLCGQNLHSLEQDAKLRIFKINAIYIDADTNFIDPLNGLADFQTKTIHCVNFDALAKNLYLLIKMSVYAETQKLKYSPEVHAFLSTLTAEKDSDKLPLSQCIIHLSKSLCYGHAAQHAAALNKHGILTLLFGIKTLLPEDFVALEALDQSFDGKAPVDIFKILAVLFMRKLFETTKQHCQLDPTTLTEKLTTLISQSFFKKLLDDGRYTILKAYFVELYQSKPQSRFNADAPIYAPC
ncbi:MAG: CCA-adding enzyme [Gammaproteobacteria bacterium]|nr:CCA-adding enzyme [Gammaproteobacteria bacterium]